VDDRGTYLSLFSGVGGLDLAAEALGFRCVAQIEWDRSCSAVLERHWPDVERWGDVATYPRDPGCDGGAEPDGGAADACADGPSRRADIDGRTRRRGDVDLIIGGFPRQPFSTAGKRGGKSDERYLWPEFRRIIDEARPSLVWIENVPGAALSTQQEEG